MGGTTRQLDGGNEEANDLVSKVKSRYLTVNLTVHQSPLGGNDVVDGWIRTMQDD